MEQLPTSPSELLKYCKDKGIDYVDVRFTDMLGMMHHFTMHINAMDESDFTEGLGFDGSSIRGWKAINESDMLAVLDASSAYIDPFFEKKTLAVIADIYEPGDTPTEYARSPRTILKRAVEYMKSTGVADQVFFGPEAEFFIFSDVRFDQETNSGFYFIDSIDARWNMGSDEGPNLGFKMRTKEGYFPLPPNDHFQDLRGEMLAMLEKMGIPTEKHHHEVSSAGQAEINFKLDEAPRIADKLQLYKYVVKNVARKHGFSATFMPKPLFGDNGTGMHTHQSLWKDGKNLFAGKGYANMSDMAMNYIAGILTHGPALLSFTNPTTNSYKRLVPGFEAPVNLVYSARNRSASIRIPIAVHGDKARRIEFRTPDAACNPYLAFAAMLMAGLDGVEKKLDPGKPADFNLYDATPEQLEGLHAVPANLTKVLDALEEDNDWLTKGDVFTQDFIDNYIEYKREEVEQIVNQRPHPYEFVLYYDC
ncbi:MAG: type I glutamate--ammonia ligase [Spirochaetaceae bacterium]|nr:type I glutamate--ammonia ligase [Spirochaetaceae bacterium]|tara:strand:- start:9121 stop:10551 length:1431 start_codon:yes stop_codon:yes gene_type:complete